jgi:hypothetical protein
MSAINLLNQDHQDFTSYKRNELASSLCQKHNRKFLRSSSYKSLVDEKAGRIHEDMWCQEDDDKTALFAKKPCRFSWKSSLFRVIGFKYKQVV